jgi:ArsR family transcriptional regulator, arsenate/arsenite/antimonite-responsive transcriptional repressor
MKFGLDCSSCFAGLTCETRIGIINLFRKNDKLSVTVIAKHFKLSQPTISYHLKYLKDRGILTSQKQGKEVFYRLNSKCANEGCSLFI